MSTEPGGALPFLRHPGFKRWELNPAGVNHCYVIGSERNVTRNLNAVSYENAIIHISRGHGV